jgi:hypothetical protein
LNTQRLARPSSPHFTIYQPQLTWIASIANRVTGAGLSLRASSLLISIHFSTRVLTQRGVQSSTGFPSHISSLLPRLAAQTSSSLLRASQSGSGLLRRQSLPRHSHSTRSTACVTSLGIPENVCLPPHSCPRWGDTDKCIKSSRLRVHTVQVTQSLVPPPSPRWLSCYCRGLARSGFVWIEQKNETLTKIKSRP